MNAAVDALFQHARSKVTYQDIRDYSPSDPSYGKYVSLWTQIRLTGNIPRETKFPRETEFHLSEVINLVGGFGKPWPCEQEPGYRRLRRFTSSVGIALLHFGNDSWGIRPSNYLARDLLIELDRSSKQQVSILREVVAATREVLLADGDPEYPFYTFSAMILAQIARDWRSAEAAATQLISDESAVRKNDPFVKDDRFLLGLSVFDQLNNEWIAFAQGLKNPNKHDDTQLVIEALKTIGG